MALRRFLIPVLLFFAVFAVAQHNNEHGSNPAQHQETPAQNTHPTEGVKPEQNTENHGTAHEAEEKYNPTKDIMNHIGDANEFHYWGHYSIPLPCILYSKEDGLKTFMSSKFHHGSVAVDRYVSDHGVTKRITDLSFPEGEVELEAVHEERGEKHYVHHEEVDGVEVASVHAGGKKYVLERSASLIKGSSFYDFSITKNVFTMLMAGFLLLFLGTKVANSYRKEDGFAPKGTLANAFESVVQFIADEVAKPMIGNKYMKFLPYLLMIFFFILVNNLFGLIPFAPFGANVTGNIATTAALALIAFLVTNLNGKADYWKHIFWMPGVSPAMKIFLAPIELIGVFTKPISLMIRLFANITAGHTIILALVSLIFVFGNAGKSMAGSVVGATIAVPFTLFLSVIELIVAFIQAFIFTILTASYIGAAIEEHHHEEAHH